MTTKQKKPVVSDNDAAIARLIRRGVKINQTRWDIEGELEKLIGHEVGDFVNFWGDRSIASGRPSRADVLSWVEDLKEERE